MILLVVSKKKRNCCGNKTDRMRIYTLIANIRKTQKDKILIFNYILSDWQGF